MGYTVAMEIIGEAALREAISVSQARTAVHNAFCALAREQVVAPDEFAMKLDHGGELHIKGAYTGGDVIAFKVATGQFPSGVNSGFTSVIDASTGAPVAILDDGGWLTEMRTAAASAVSAVALARPESSTLAILGGGHQAAFQVAALRDALAIDTVRVWSRTSETAERFASEQHASAMSTVGAAVEDADIIVCCTPSTEPLLTSDMVAPGTHVIAMGADMAGKRELAADLVASSDVLVCDSLAVASHAGELQHVQHSLERWVELGAVLTGQAVGRTTVDQVTIVDLCGLGIQDAAMAELVMAHLGTTPS